MNQELKGRGPVILQVIPRLEVGGAERAVIDVARATIEAGGTALVVSEGGELEPELLRAKARHINMPVASKSPLAIQRNAGRLADLIRSESVDLIHARSRAPAWSALKASKRAGIPFVTTFHAPYNFKNGIKKRYNSVMTRGDRVIAISEFVAKHIRENYGVGDDRLRLIHRGINVVGFDPAAVSTERVASLAARWNLPDGVPIVMLPGRLARWKGQHVMVNAMQQLQRDAICLLVGVGSGREGLRREIEKDIAQRSLQGRAVLIDGIQDMAAAYRLADVVVSASIEPEGFGRVAVEAQAMGVPVVATNHGGAQETVEPGVTGWLVRPDDPAALSQAVAAALDLDEEARVKLAAVARARTVERFSRTAMCAATLDVYRELIAWP
ncbi:MAG: glycosyltransferase family 4 protein [Alphaproteobacteria bacterium]|jgi:glycosyltransferase involved in cell wall biosynthesis|nr:glycosyltransferase family 4 protein [Rhodospirillaceae bacterium]MBT6511526.1 glycosyltransferase family 4 protein [Rhodospirillaceae bacterium]MDG2480726.1 glycosyltransferase family 4 protein [Alphaproteobacteria bacterium]